MPDVTIITPTYNHERFVGPCIRSVLAQNDDSWEQIIIDDGSEDRTGEVVKAFRDSRIVYVRRAHQGIAGLGSAYNRAFEMANGNLIAILEGDDTWPERKLELQKRSFSRSNVLLSWGDGIIVDPNGKSIGTLKFTHGGDDPMLISLPRLARLMLFRNVLRPSSGVMVRREALERVGGFVQPPGVPYVDLPTWFRLLTKAEPGEVFAYLGRPLANWRSHPGQVSRARPLMLSARAKILTELENWLRKDGGTLELNPGEIAAWACMCRARSAAELHQWSEARREASACERLGTGSIKVRALAFILGTLLHSDPFGMAADIQDRLPTAVDTLARIVQGFEYD